MEKWFSVLLLAALALLVPLVFGEIGTPCNGRDCEFSPGGVKVSCPAASGPDSLKVNESGIMTGTCSDGIDNDCDGKVDANDPQCGLVQNCNASLHDEGATCAGNVTDLSNVNIADGMYCDTNGTATTSDNNHCCSMGTEWDPSLGENGGCVGTTSGCYNNICSFPPFSGNETPSPEDKWWNYTGNPCINVSQSEACVRDGFKYGNKYYNYKGISAY